MKIVVISSGPFPQKGKPIGRIHYICRALVTKGVDVEVVVAHPKVNDRTNDDVVIDGVVFSYISKRLFKSKSRILYLINVLLCQLKVLFYLLINRFRADAIIVYPSFDYRLLIPFAGYIARSKVIMEINELPFVDRPGWLSKVKRAVLFNVFFRFYDGFIVISDNLATKVNKYKSKKSRVVKIPVITDKATKVPYATSPYPFKYIFHAGSLTEEKDGILGMIEAFGIAKKNNMVDLKYIITGDKSKCYFSKQIDSIIHKYGLEDHVVFTGFLSQEQLYIHLQYCSLAIVNKYDTLQNKYCFATKIAEYLSYSIPVITTTVGEAKNFLSDGVDSFLVEPLNTEMLADKIIEALTSEDKRQQIAKGGLDLFERSFNYMRYCDTLNDFIRNIVLINTVK